MSRSRGSLVLAAFGWLILANAGAGPPNKANVQGQRADDRREAPAPPPPAPERYRPYSDYKADDCYKDSQHESADLCAQWRAAVAGEKAAHRVLWGNWISAAGAALSFASIVLVLIALKLNRQANRLAMKANSRATRRAVAGAKETEAALAVATRNADAAKALAEISDRNSKLQLRAYVSIVPPTLSSSTDTFVSAYLKFRNDGATPAKITTIHIKTWVAEVPMLDPKKSGPPVDRHYHFRPILNPGCNEEFLFGFSDAQDIAKCKANTGKSMLFVYGDIAYEDVFGAPHITNFAYRTGTGHLEKEMPFVPCTDGNDSD